MIIERWGLTPYIESTQRQLKLVEDVMGGGDERLILCSHPPVVTLGRSAVTEDISGWTGELVEVSRGGRATYHGPSQLVIYPIMDLRKEHQNFKFRDVHAYLRALEQATVVSLGELGVVAEVRHQPAGDGSLTGVWVGEKKVASIGIAVKGWVTYHGVAVNLRQDPQAFRGIRPCGFQPEVMTSVEALTGRESFQDHEVDVFSRCFQSQLRRP